MAKKFYKCVRDLKNYRFNGGVYNFSKGTMLPESDLIKRNREYFEISNVFEQESKAEVFTPVNKNDVFLILGTKKIELSRVV